MTKNGLESIPRQERGFTLLELVVAIAVLTLLIVLVSQLLNGTTAIITLGEKRMDTDAQARAVLDRIAVDFSRMVKRPDVDFFLKTDTQPQTGEKSGSRNDQMAFYSEVPGYYLSEGSQSPSPISLVSYRVKSVALERMGKGLPWNGAPSGAVPMVYLPLTIQKMWPAATNNDDDPDYEIFGPEIFRFEYGYILKGGKRPDGTQLRGTASELPWDIRLGHKKIDGLRDVAAIIVHIAVIAPKSRVLVDNLLGALAEELTDFDGRQKPGELENAWQSTIDQCALPPQAKSSMRIYRRVYPL